MKETVRGTFTLAGIAWRASPGRFIGSLLLMTVQFASLPLAAPALGRLTDATIARESGSVTASAFAVATLAIMTLTAGHFGRVVAYELGEMVQLAIETELIALSNGSDGLDHHERPDYADRLAVVRQEVNWSGWPTIDRLFTAMGFVVGASITAVLLAMLTPWLLLLPVFALPPLILGRRAEAAAAKARLDAAPHTRRARHVLRLATEATSAKEIRACGLTEQMRERQRESWEAASAIVIRGEQRAALLRVGGQAVFAVAYITATLLVVRLVVAGEGSVGDVVLAIALAAQVNQQVTQAAALLVGLQRTARTQADLAWIRELVTSRVDAPGLDMPAAIATGITFRDVDFAYPGTTAGVLTGVNLRLPAGSTVAIVGENGAGKTTLVKLLSRFYSPTSGMIEVDGIPVTRYPVSEWRARISAGFQDFARFEFVARETVGLGDLPRITDSAAVEHALQQARGGDVIERLASGLETQLGRAWEGGTDLSGGQWQKLALGRAMMRQAPLLLVLDEPTSALDAQAEHDLFEDYAKSAKRVAATTGGITVLVSHRFSTVRMADLIVVVGDGKIQETGSHAELMERGGLYAELYTLQAKSYAWRRPV